MTFEYPDSFEKAWMVAKRGESGLPDRTYDLPDKGCDHEWGADKWVCTNKGCQAEITDADTEDVGDCLNHDDHNWKPQNYKCQECGEREE